jgi:hypothetical protein
VLPAREAAIREALKRQHHWEENTEWRIFTPMISRIEHRVEDNRWVFRVTVSCDYELSAASPTLERALEFLGLFERLIPDLWQSLGWPSWASREAVQP